ncbi:unnamed protein product [Trichogramma brassicae]|uniref:Uncharacterized protein n=1 Tax=Trichogramma brassicae TaxID=86971 RepID=A0A6H5I0L3_9HYME|nr:unnamed protein product [Trichogramma brassicae]
MTLSSCSSRLARKNIGRCGSMLGTRKAVRRCIWLWTRARKRQSNCCREMALIRIQQGWIDCSACLLPKKMLPSATRSTERAAEQTSGAASGPTHKDALLGNAPSPPPAPAYINRRAAAVRQIRLQPKRATHREHTRKRRVPATADRSYSQHAQRSKIHIHNRLEKRLPAGTPRGKLFTPEQLELQQELDALNEVMMRNLLETPMSEEDWTALTDRTTDLTIDDTPPTQGSGQESTGGTNHGDATGTRRTIGRGSTGSKKMGHPT